MMLKKTLLVCNAVLFLWLCLTAVQDARWLAGLRIDIKPRKETCVTRLERRAPEKIQGLRPVFGVSQDTGKSAGGDAESSKTGKPSVQTRTHIIRLEGLSSIPGRRMALLEISPKQARKGAAREVKKVQEGSLVLNLKVVKISSREIVFESLENGQQITLAIFRKNNTVES